MLGKHTPEEEQEREEESMNHHDLHEGWGGCQGASRLAACRAFIASTQVPDVDVHFKGHRRRSHTHTCLETKEAVVLPGGAGLHVAGFHENKVS